MTEDNDELEPLLLFYSYAPADEELRAELEKHLALLRRQKIISEWHLRCAMPGKSLVEEVDEHLRNADIVLLLVSADFLASDYCYDTEMYHAVRSSSVVPIIIRPCDWDRAPFRRLITLPRNDKPVTLWSNRDEAWTDVVREIRRRCEQLLSNKQKRREERIHALSCANWSDGAPAYLLEQPASGNPQREHERARDLALAGMRTQRQGEFSTRRMVARSWQRNGARSTIETRRPDRFIHQQVRPLFYGRTEDASKLEDCLDIISEEHFWRQEGGVLFGTVRLREFRIVDWFPRTPGVYWSRNAVSARESARCHTRDNDAELGNYFGPDLKKNLVVDGGLGTIRLLRRKIDNEFCWLATALTGTECHGGIPLAIPMTLLNKSGIRWGDYCNLRGRVRFLQEVGLNDIAASVRHARPLIVFIEELEGVTTHQAPEPILITPVVLFYVRGEYGDFQYTFVNCNAGQDAELDTAGDWIERYAAKHGGQVITNFDEQRPLLADAPLSYQRLVARTYDRDLIRNFTGTDLAAWIDKAVQDSGTTEPRR